MEKKLKKVQELLKKENQEHLLVNYNNLSDEKKEELLDQILNIDFKQMNKLYENIIHKKEPKKEDVIEKTPYVEKTNILDEEYIKHGEDILKQGKFAVITMAGGQGTRLRTHRPKRNFCIKH